MEPQDLGSGRLFETVWDAAIVADAGTGRIVSWNSGATQIFGYPPSEALGMSVEEIVPEYLKEEHGDYTDSHTLLDLSAVRKTGEEIRVELSLSPVEPGRGSGKEGCFVLAIVRDVTERKRTEEALERRVEERAAQLGAGLAESEERYRSFVEQSTEAIWRFELEEPVPTDIPEDEQISRFYRYGYLGECNDAMARMYGYERAEEIVGARLGDLLPRSVPGNMEYLRSFVRSGYRLNDAASEEVDRGGKTRYFVNNLTGIVERGSVVRVWGTQRDVTERRRTDVTQRFLAEASEMFSSSLDYRETLASVARLAVPTLADWCAVDVLEEDGSVERLAVEHEDQEKVTLALKLQERYPSDPDAPSGVPNVLRTGRPEFYPEVTDEMLESAARDEEHLELLREVGFRSVIIVPMVVRGRTLGAIILVSAESGRRYGEVDLGLTGELARRAALAVDNARLYEEAQREIAEREWAEQELRRSRDQLEIILRGVADGITAQDPTGRLVYANEAAARMVGYPSARAFVETPLEEAMHKFEVLDEEGRPFPLERLPGRRALLGEEGAEEVLRFRVLETGEERWSVVSATPVFDERGGIRMAVNVFRDVTEQRRAEEERARLASIVESSDNAIIGKTLEGIITSWNKGAEKIYGYSSEEAVGRPIAILVPAERPDEIPGILDMVSRGERVDHFETVRMTKDGRRLDISLTVSPIRGLGGEIVGASTIARDISGQKRAEETLREMREAERRRIARDLHDGVLQDLAYTVQAMEVTRLNAAGTALEEELEEEADAVRGAVQGLRAAVNDLRLGDELNRPFLALVESLVDRNRAMARGYEIGLEVEEGFPATPLGEAGTELLRIIQEALTNARRHSKARNVVVTLRMEGEDLVSEVADDGRGFAPGTTPGVGLGSMSERAAALGGRVEVESRLQEGTTVRLRVPVPGKGQ